jgi:hypothetical protein
VFSKCPYLSNSEHTALYLSIFGLMTDAVIIPKNPTSVNGKRHTEAPVLLNVHGLELP